MEGMKDMFSVKDYINGAYHSFMPTYQEYVIPRSSTNHSMRSCLVGNLLNSKVECKDEQRAELKVDV